LDSGLDSAETPYFLGVTEDQITRILVPVFSRIQFFGFWIGFWPNPLFSAPPPDYNSLGFAKYPPPPEVIIY
jgi:hypothetical protein